MDENEFWKLIDEARAEGGSDEATVERAVTLLARRTRAEIVAAQQVLWNLLAASYRTPLWAAAYLINGGSSDDGFDYFRGWLLLQGRETYTAAVADPDALAVHPAVRAAAETGEELEWEPALGIAWDAHRRAFGEVIPADAWTIDYPALEPFWDFDDRAENGRRLPLLTGMFLTAP
ncbi:DUF4240 domain-containing protein [Actinomadura flavalba]|uniref:DUF4240 domain-containing protein n=1 Tax=Actinomadura flavalba TaxID=1120938 RepID=UPI00037B5428|nr:DUF4240 domain-containing protein [Actinomadura flavalba]